MESSNELLWYALSVVAFPALIAWLAAMPALVGPLRTRRAAVEMSVAFALALAFLVSFVRELEVGALTRQFPWSPLDPSAPIERWHRLALIALALCVLAPVLAGSRELATRGMDRLLSAKFIVIASLCVGLLVQFPESTALRQWMQALLCAVSAYYYSRLGGAALCVSAIVFASLAALTLLAGCASFAVMCAATSLAAFGMAIIAAIGAWRNPRAVAIVSGGAFALVAGILTASVAMAGRAYDMMSIPVWVWPAVACLPVGGFVFDRLARRAPHRAAATFWRTLGVFLLAIVLFVAVMVLQAADSKEGEGGADPMDGIYGVSSETIHVTFS